jgi:hypothetical protein
MVQEKAILEKASNGHLAVGFLQLEQIFLLNYYFLDTKISNP